MAWVYLALALCVLHLAPSTSAQGTPGEPVITQQPHDAAAPEGGTAAFTVVATGGELRYQWFFRANGSVTHEPVPDATNATLVIAPMRAMDAGFYHVTVQNDFETVPSTPAQLLLVPNATRFLIRCRDGKPITNGCTVTATLTNSSGYAVPKICTSPIGYPNDPWYWTGFTCTGGLDLTQLWWFHVEATCCTNVWIIPTTSCYGDYDLFTCDSCGDCPRAQITCPNPATLLAPCDQPCVAYTYPNPAVTGGGLVSCLPASGSCFPVGSTTVTCTATNLCGDPTTCQFPVTVKPCLKCPRSRIYECGTRWDFDPPTVEPGCGPIQYGVLSTVTNGQCPQTIIRTWSVQMECGGGLGLITQCQQVVTVVDTTPPIVVCAPDKSVVCGSDWSFDPPVVADDGCNSVTVQVLSVVTNLPCTPRAHMVCTWVATDACGNSNTCSQTVYQDQSAPLQVVCPPDKQVECIADWSFDPPQVVSSCSLVTISVLNTLTNGSCPVRVTRTWMIDDQCGHVQECSQTVTLLNATSLQTVFTLFSGAPSSGFLPIGAPDPRFTFGCLPPGIGPVTPVVTTPNAFWMPNGPNSQWIGPTALNDGPPGVYCYNVEFTLPTCPTGTPRYALKGRWAADDTGAIHLNGSPTGVVLPNGWAFTNWHPFTITSGLVPGPNLLTFYVTNGPVSTGLRVELAASALCCGCSDPCLVEIKCPTNIINTSCRDVENVTYSLPTASSTCGPITSVVCVPPSGSPFPVGTTVVTCTATDAQGHSAQCQFSVTHSVANPWQIVCPPLVQNVSGCPPLMPDLTTQIGFITNCPFACPFQITQSIPAGTQLTPGTHVVILRVCDCTGVCHDCDVILTASLLPGCCLTPPCVMTPMLSLFSGKGSSGLLPAGAADPQFSTAPPLFAGPSPKVITAPAGAWVPNSAASKWIGPAAGAGIGAASGVYRYTNRFFLCSTREALLTGRWTGDNTGVLELNGVVKSALPLSGWGFATWIPININSGFVPGWNELTFTITNWSGPTGLRTEIAGRACCTDCVRIDCPGNIVTNSCASSTPVSWLLPASASSICGTLQSVTCTPPSGSSFPAGTSVVSCTALDSCGNAAQCSFTVTVHPAAPPPVIHCPPDRLLYTCSNSAPAYFKIAVSGAAGPVSCTPPSGSAFPIGSTVVTCTATNACGLTATCSFTVTVKHYPSGPPWWDWPCLTAVLADGVPFVPQGNARVVTAPPIDLPSFGPIVETPALCLTPAPGANVADVALHVGGASAFAFTTVLDLEAPDGSTIEIVDPTDPAGVPTLTLTLSRGTKCWDLKKCKGLISDADAFRVSAVNPQGELLDSFVQTFNEGNTNAALTLFAEEGVTQFPITLIFDRTDGTISVDFPGDVAQRACCRHKGWDGTVKGSTKADGERKGWDGLIKGRPLDATRVTFTPVQPHPTTGPEIHLVTRGLPEFIVTGEQFKAMGDPATGQPPVIAGRDYDKSSPQLYTPFKRQAAAYGPGVHWASPVDESGPSLDLGEVASFEFAFEHELLPGNPGTSQYIEFRTGGFPLAQTNRTGRPPISAYLRLTKNPDGVACTVDFSYLPATSVTVQLYRGGTLVGAGTADGPIIGEDSPLQLADWPATFGQMGVDGVLRLGAPRIVVINDGGQTIAGDEVRFVPALAPDAELPAAISVLECLGSEDVLGTVHDLRSTRACVSTTLHIDRTDGGVVLTWSGLGYRLQGAETVQGPWLDLGGSAPVHLPASAPLRAFRLICE